MTPVNVDVLPFAVPRPKLLLLDEPSLGLSPALASSAFGRIAEINRESGVTVLIVEQRVREVLWKGPIACP